MIIKVVESVNEPALVHGVQGALEVELSMDAFDRLCGDRLGGVVPRGGRGWGLVLLFPPVVLEFATEHPNLVDHLIGML